MNDKPTEENAIHDKEAAKLYDIQILRHPVFGNVRTIIVDGKIWFNGTDIAHILKQQNANAVIESCVNEENTGYAKFPIKGGLRTMVVVDQLGLIALVYESEMKSKQEFKEWLLSKTAMDVIEADRQSETILAGDVMDEDFDNMQSMNAPNVIQIFGNSAFGDVRTLMIDGEPYFVGADAASALGYDQDSIRNALKQHIDDRDKFMCQINTGAGKRNMTIINESGLYSLIFSSNLPDAKEFMHWVTSEVLPTLQKTGSYTMPNAAHSHFTKNDLEMVKLIAKATPRQLSVIESMLKDAGCSIDWKVLEQQGTKTLALLQDTQSPNNSQNKVRHKRPVKFTIKGSINEQQLECITDIFAGHIDREIAERIDVTRTTISKYRHGVRVMDQSRCEEIIAAFSGDTKE